IEEPHRLSPCLPLARGTQQVLLRDGLEHRSDVLRHAAVHEHETLLELRREALRQTVVQELVHRQEPAAADPELGIALARELAADQLDARPHAAGVLPAAAGAAEPLTEDRARRDRAPFDLREPAGESVRLAGRTHAHRDRRREEVRRHREPRTLRDTAHARDELEAETLTDEAFEQLRSEEHTSELQSRE